MKAKDVFARFAGGTAGVVTAMAVPHIGCLAALTPVFVAAGGSAALAVTATYAAGAVILAGGAVAAWYGLRRSREACCLVFGETRSVRIKKGAAVAAFAFAGFALLNTVMNSGPAIEDRAVFLQIAHENGSSVWKEQQNLDFSCLPQNAWWRRFLPGG